LLLPYTVCGREAEIIAQYAKKDSALASTRIIRFPFSDVRALGRALAYCASLHFATTIYLSLATKSGRDSAIDEKSV
jgi:hypothetical protein